MVPTGTKAWIARLDALEPPSSDADHGPAALSTLTAAERRVAMAVGGGLTNKEAADELFVSVKTIDSHLQRIYPKLQIRSRSELAAIVNGSPSLRN
jgi:DNA-binding NarL/FixJ family response regulator